jgi:hypothetical protein
MSTGIDVATLSDVDSGILSYVNNAPSSYNSVNSYGVSYSGGTLSLTPADNSDYGASVTVTGLEPYTEYILQYTVASATDGSHALQTIDNYSTIDSRNRGGPGTYWRSLFTNASGEITQLMFGRGSIGSTSGSVTNTFTNISLSKAVADRSYNKNGFEFVGGGNLKKEDVAPGSDLVAYTGFSSQAYLRQPYNPNMDYGTGDFHVMAWVKPPTSNSIIFERQDSASSGQLMQMFFNSGRFYFYAGDSSDYAYTRNWYSDTNRWNFVVGAVKNRKFEIYVNGVYDISVVGGNPTSVTNTSAITTIGVQTNGTSEPMTNGSIALLRISNGSITQEDILKIYNDEKRLFEPNSKATIYSRRDIRDVNALAYDKGTDLLHVGTNDGRSVFSGLERVDHTTDEVATSISAVNGMVIEE